MARLTSSFAVLLTFVYLTKTRIIRYIIIYYKSYLYYAASHAFVGKLI